MRLIRLLSFVIAVVLVAAACGGTPTSGTSATPAVPSTASRTTGSVRSDSQTASSAATPSIDDALLGPGETRYAVDASRSEASYRVREQLARLPSPSDAVGKSNTISGSIVLRQDGSIDSSRSKIVLDLRTLKSDESRRDNFIQNNPLQTSRYPYAEFVPTAAQGLPTPLPTSSAHTFQLVGNMMIHGVTKQITWQTDATFGTDAVSGKATTSFVFSDFGMSPPSVMVVLSVQDTIALELDFTVVPHAS